MTSKLGLNLGSARKISIHRDVKYETLSALTQRIYFSPTAYSSSLSMGAADNNETGSQSSVDLEDSDSDAVAAAAAAAVVRDKYELAQIIVHNLTYQHRWTSLSFFRVPLSLSPAQAVPESTKTGKTWTLVRGCPPERIYVHPDQQLLELEARRQQRQVLRAEEAMYVLPTRKHDRLTLKELGNVFDAIPLPSSPTATDNHHHYHHSNIDNTDNNTDNAVAGADADLAAASSLPEWETTKRILLAVLDDDSTVAYYILHDGVIKPRQN